MPEFKDLPADFCCPYQHGCPYLEGLSTGWVFRRYRETGGVECAYEYQLEELHRQLRAERRGRWEEHRENQELRAQLRALHRRQFKGRRRAPPPAREPPTSPPKKRGAPVGHPPWQRPRPKRIDLVVRVPAPKRCTHCHRVGLQPVTQTQEHLQEDIVLEPRTRTTAFVHELAYCPDCDCKVLQAGPGELPGSYIGPAAKATEAYLRHELNVPYRKISRFFDEFFGLKFVPASAYGFERQAVRRGLPLYEDLRQKIRALDVAHADETSWRHDGHSSWVWYAGDQDLAFFHLDEHRTIEAAQKVLGSRFAGTIVADAYAGYKGVHPKDWQSCLAHIKTKARELEQEVALLKGAALDPAALGFCKDIQGWVHDTCEAHRRLSQKPWRAARAKRAECACRHQLQKLCARPLGYEKAEAFRKRLRGPEQKHFFTCFRRPNVPPTNNQAERSLRPMVILRKVIQGTRSQGGLENHSVVRSLYETARRQGHRAHEFFLKLFTCNTAQAQAALYRKKLGAKPPRPLRC